VILILEVLREIPGFNGYFADVWGCIYSSHRGSWERWPKFHRIRTHPDQDGYETVVLSPNGQRKRQAVHRLVALAFLGPKPEGCVVCHYNGMKSDNAVSNLIYATQAENVRQGQAAGRTVRGERSHLAKLTEQQAREILRRLGAGESQIGLAREFGVGLTAIQGLKTGRTWRHLTAVTA